MAMQIPGFLNKKTLTRDRFVRNTLIRLYSAGDAAEFIDDVQITDVASSTSQFLLNYGFYDVEYSCEVGYDREEQYIAEEEYYDKQLQRHVKRPVVKHRTVTDWRPYTTCEKRIPGSDIRFIDNDAFHQVDNPMLFFPRSLSLEDFRKEDLVTDDAGRVTFEAPAADDLRAARSASEDMAVSFVRHNRLPGDKQRRFTKQQVTASTEHQMLVAVEHWRAAFALDGNTYYATQYANLPHPTLHCTYHKEDAVETELRQNEKEEIASDADHQKFSKIGRYCSFGFIGGLLLAVAVSGTATGLGIFLFIAAFAALGVSLFLKKKTDAIEKRVHDKYDAMRADYKQTVCNKKIELLNARLASMGQPPLSSLELEQFDPNTSRTLTGS
ncbi:MAG: hypothetical protein E7553_03055 [Ruminococcaceae bacterium]|nr:hypothetical protein [Oscillospiraceae bacterium]